MRRDLSPHSYLDLTTAWLAATEAEHVMQALLREVTWEQREIILFGKAVLQPRRIGWGGSLPYRYSGQTLPLRELPAVVGELLDRVRGFTELTFNHVLLNHYRDGADSMGLHADNEPELGVHPQVASLSLGAARRFVLKPRRGGESVPLTLSSGDLLVMGGRCQREFVHGLPKQKTVVGERISLTFRNVLAAPGQLRSS